MKYTTIYHGKEITVPITVNLDSIGNLNSVSLAITVPFGLTINSWDIPQGSFDPETLVWSIGTMVPATELESSFTFTVTDEGDLTSGSEIEISWEVSYPGVETNAQNNFASQTYAPILCSEIRECVGCDFGDYYYPCRSFIYTVELNNYTTDIQENIKVNFESSEGLHFKSVTVNYGSFNLGEDPEGGISSVGISDLACAGTYYSVAAWHIPTLPALTVATATITVFVTSNELDECNGITWEAEGGVFNGVRGTYLPKGTSGENFNTATGYKEWAGRVYYSTLPVSVGGVTYASNYKAVAYNRNKINFLGDLTLTNTAPGEFELTSSYDIFTSYLIAIPGQKSTASGALNEVTYVDARTVTFTVDPAVTTDLDITLNIKVY
jgi:hypothetical protein